MSMDYLAARVYQIFVLLIIFRNSYARIAFNIIIVIICG